MFNKQCTESSHCIIVVILCYNFFMDILHEITINKLSTTPLYAQLRDSILKAIETGLLKDKDKLPTENEICLFFNISKTVVRQAYSDLLSLGRIERHKSKGTFVKQIYKERCFTQELTDFNNEMIRQGLHPSTKLIYIEKINWDERAYSVLNIPKGHECLHFKRLRLGSNTAIYVEETFLSLDNFPNLDAHNFGEESLFKVLNDEYNTKIIKAYTSYKAVIVSDADSRILDLPKHSAVHRVETQSYNQNNQIVEFSIAYFPGTRNRFSLIVKRNHR